jgi:hypothetical protein
VRISYVEIYNEDVRDLLAGKDSKTLQATPRLRGDWGSPRPHPHRDRARPLQGGTQRPFTPMRPRGCAHAAAPTPTLTRTHRHRHAHTPTPTLGHGQALPWRSWDRCGFSLRADVASLTWVARVQIHDDAKSGPYVKGALEKVVSTAEDALAVLAEGPRLNVVSRVP